MSRRSPRAVLLVVAGILSAGAFSAGVLPAGCRSAHIDSASLAKEQARVNAIEKARSDFDAGVRLASSGRYADAVSVIFPLVRTFESLGLPDNAAESIFWTAFCYEKLGRWDDASSFYRSVISKYPKSRVARNAAERLALRSAPPAPEK